MSCDTFSIGDLVNLFQRVFETWFGVLLTDMLADACVGGIAEAGFGEEAGGRRRPDIDRDIVLAQIGNESGFRGAGDGVVVELVD